MSDPCPKRGRYGQGGQLCYCGPGCSVCGYGEHMAVHLPPPEGGRPWHHTYSPGDSPPNYYKNSWGWRDHPREGAPTEEQREDAYRSDRQDMADAEYGGER